MTTYSARLNRAMPSTARRFSTGACPVEEQSPVETPLPDDVRGSRSRVSFKRKAGRRMLFVLLLLLAASKASGEGQSPSLDAELRFEVDGELHSTWTGLPPETVALDSEVSYGGRNAVRIHRTKESTRGYSTLVKRVPVTAGGGTVELRGFLRTEQVSDYAAFWLRVEGQSGALAFDAMDGRRISGTSEWTEYRIRLPLEPEARRLSFGVILSGEGTAWADEFRLLVNGISLADSGEDQATVLQIDQEFRESSNVYVGELDPMQVQNLAALAKIWGFLKYHHPSVARGEHHWDFELFRVLPAVLVASDRDDRNKAILNWVSTIGRTDACAPCATMPDQLQMATDAEWIYDSSNFGKALSDYLVDVYQNRYALDQQFYITLHSENIQKPTFNHEPAYATASLSDAGYRLLALFRLWNMIEYWYPYREIMDEPWDKVLSDFIPLVLQSSTRSEYARTMLLLLAKLNDSHAVLDQGYQWQPPAGSCTTPVIFKIVERRVIVSEVLAVDAAATSSGVQVGDEVVEISGRAIAEYISKLEPYYAASNSASLVRDIAHNLGRGPCEPLKAVVERQGEEIARAIDRVPISDILAYDRDNSEARTLQWLSKDIAYINLSTIEKDSITDYFEDVASAKGLVIDIRGYPNDYVVFEVGRHLVKEAVEFAAITRPSITNPGAFEWWFRPSYSPAQPHFDGAVVVLVNEMTQSQGEFTAMALDAAPKVWVVGSTTAGADGDLAHFTLPGGFSGAFSGIGVYYPDGTPTQRRGIALDAQRALTIEDVKNGKDAILEYGLTILQANMQNVREVTH